jgi:hypothetical protein
MTNPKYSYFNEQYKEEQRIKNIRATRMLDIISKERQMNCCEYKCEQGRDCPIRKQRMEATNQAYIERVRVDTDPYAETVGSVKGLIAFICVTAALTLFTFWYWGK